MGVGAGRGGPRDPGHGAGEGGTSSAVGLDGHGWLSRRGMGGGVFCEGDRVRNRGGLSVGSEHAFRSPLGRVSSPHPKFRPFNKKTKRGLPRPACPVTINHCVPLRCLAIQFQLGMDSDSLLAILGAVSPALAAYHHVKFSNTDTADQQRSRCERCGHLLVPGTSHTRVARSSTKRKRKRKDKGRSDPIVHCIRQSCATCGHINNTLLHPINHHPPVHSDKVATLPPPAATVVVTPRTHRTDQRLLPDPPPVSSSHSHPHHSLPSPPPLTNPQPQLQTRPKKSRAKHKAGLQEMLARNKDKQRDATNRGSGSSGLATFLHGL